MDLFTVVATFVLTSVLGFLLFSKWRYSYWRRRGIVQLNPEFFYGDLRAMLTAKTSLGEAFRDLYFAFKSRKLAYGGAYWAYKPEFIPVELDLIKDIMLKSFQNFQDRGSYNHERDVLTQNLFRMDGDAWKRLRAKLSPTFTSSKMRMMFETLCEKTDKLELVLKGTNGIINITDVAARFTTDVIGSCAFGIECDSLEDPECDFRVYGKMINQPRALKQWLENTIPRRLLGYTGFRSFPHVEEFFRGVVTKTIEHREKNKIFRKDFMHLLLQLRNRGVLTDDGNLAKGHSERGILTDDEILSQCFIFFSAGFDTSSATIAFALYELAQNPSMQDTLREEIRRVTNGGKLTYDGAKELFYTERVILETLRKYPVIPSIPRVCTKTYRIPGSDVVLDQGTALQIPIWGIHMDPDYYPEPWKFDPERFSEEQNAKRPEFAYLPFGEGPRVCIGTRFGLLQSKLGLAGLIKHHRYSLLPETAGKLSFKPSLILLHPVDEIWLRVEEILN